MVQIYYFASTFLIFTGILLANKKFGNALKFNAIFTDSLLQNTTITMISGLGSVLFGIILLLQTRPPIVGDLIPALLNLVGGLSIIIQILKKEYTGEKKFLKWLQGFITANIAIIGIIMIVMGILHIIFPDVIFI